MKSKLFFVIQFLISLTLLYYAMRNIDYSVFFNNISSVNFLWFSLAVVLIFFHWIVINSLCWYVLLKPLKVEITYLKLLQANFSGIFYSLILPGQASGDIIKGMQLSSNKNEGVKYLLSIIMDRLTGFWITLAVSFIVILFTGLFDFLSSSKIIVLFSIGTFLILSLTFFISPFLNFWSRVILWFSLHTKAQFIKDIAETISICIKEYKLFSKPMLIAIFLSLLSLLSSSIIVYICAIAIDIKLPLLVFISISTVMATIQTIPISIAGIGVREIGYVFLLGKLGISSEKSILLSALTFLLFIIVALAGGVLEFTKKFK